VQLREELSNARGINDLTADETTKLLLENSHMQQVRGHIIFFGLGAGSRVCSHSDLIAEYAQGDQQ
jgi:hypothetical protein